MEGEELAGDMVFAGRIGGEESIFEELIRVRCGFSDGGNKVKESKENFGRQLGEGVVKFGRGGDVRAAKFGFSLIKPHQV